MKHFFVCCLALLLLSCDAGPKETHRIARDPFWFPLDFIGKENAVLAFSDGLIRAIGDEEGFQVSLYAVGWVQLQQVLRQGTVDGILSAIPPTPFFRRSYDFSDVYLHVGPVLVVPVESDAHSLEEMKEKIVGVLTGSPSMIVAAQIPDVVIIDYMEIAIALEECARGEIDGVLLPRLRAYAYVRDFYDEVLHVVTPPLTDEGLRLLVLKGEKEDLLEEFNDGLKEMHENGTYDKLQEKWGLDLQEGPPPPIS